MSRLREEAGFTLAELLVGAMLMMIVMFASLSVLDQFRVIGSRTETRIDLQDRARQASRQLAKSLRNLAASPDVPGVVERAYAYDLVFRAVDKPRADAAGNTRNLRRVRYCLDASAPANARLLEQTQRWSTTATPAVPAGTACPASAWGASRVVSDRITNRATEVDRPLFAYRQTEAGQITTVKLSLFMNADPATRSREVGLQTGVFLRNQNRAPTASFTAAVAGTSNVLLNGSPSSDPDGQPLDYFWYAGGVEIGRGLIFDYAAGPGTHTLRLEVRDPGGLGDQSPDRAVVIE